MHETLEEVQTVSRKIIKGDLRIYFSLLSLFFVVFSGKSAVYITAFMLFSALSIHAAGKHYLKVVKIPAYFLTSSMLVLVVFIPGNPVFKLPFLPLAITDEGLRTATITTTRAFASLSVLAYLILTTTIPEIFSALKRLKLPEFVVETALLMYRTIQILMDEAMRLDRAASSRLGYISKRAFVNTAALLSYSLFIKSLNRAEKLDNAMEARCYQGVMPVMKYSSSGYGYASIVLLSLMVAWLVG
jgi:cobalt/nickel transport system permease protein